MNIGTTKELKNHEYRVGLTPDNVVSYVNCGHKVYVETKAGEGAGFTDEEYREKYKRGTWTGLEFKPLQVQQFMGLAAFDVGNLYLEKDPPRALTWYRMAEEFFAEYPGIRVNQEVAKSRLP